MILTLTTRLAQSCSSPPFQKLCHAEMMREKRSHSTSRTAWKTKAPAPVYTFQECQELARPLQLWKWSVTWRQSIRFHSSQSTQCNWPTPTWSTQSSTRKLLAKKLLQLQQPSSLTNFSRKRTSWRSWPMYWIATRPQNLIRCKTKSCRTKPTSWESF